MSDRIQVTSEGWRFTMVPNGPMLDTSLSATQKAVFVALCTFLGNNGNTVWPSYRRIAKRAGCSRRSTITAIGELVERGYIHKNVRFYGVNQDSNEFVVSLSADKVLISETRKPIKRKDHVPSYRRKIDKKRHKTFKQMIENGIPYVCAVDGCGETVNLHIDHKHPLSKGGSNDIANLQFLCQKHNCEKGNKINYSFEVESDNDAFI